MSGIWTCARCRAANGSQRETCALCGAPRDAAAAPPPAPRAPAPATPPSRSAARRPAPPAPAPHRAAEHVAHAASRAAAHPAPPRPAVVADGVCPECGTRLATGRESDVPSLDCPRGHGRWLDENEVSRLLRSSPASAPKTTLSPRRLWSSIPPHRAAPRACPRCGAATVTHASTSTGPVWMDECPHHHGIWFDRDELEVFVAFVREGGLAHHVAAHATMPAASAFETWEAHAHAEPVASGFHWWWYLK
jgi:Zn-finger nucleic acid-binding protein